MRRESRKVKGKIGGGFSGNPFAKNVKRSIRVSSARKTVRTKEVWVCGHRAACDDPDYYDRIYAAEVEKARKVAEQEAEQARKVAEQKAEQARKVAEQKAEQARKDAEQAERDRIARETERKIAGLSTEICDWVNSGKIKDKHEVDVDKLSALKQRFEERINTEYSKLPHLNRSQKEQYSDFVTKTVNSKKLGSFLYESGSSISTPLVNALPSEGKIEKGFLWRLIRLSLWILLFVSIGSTFLFLGSVTRQYSIRNGHDVSVVEDQSKSETHASPSAPVEYYNLDGDQSKSEIDASESESEIYSGSLFVKFLNLLAITKDQKNYALPNWHDLEDSFSSEIEWERKYNDEPFEYWVTQTSNPHFVGKRATRFVIQGHGARALIFKLELQTHDGAEFRSLLNRLSKIENVEILDTRCDSESAASFGNKHAIIEFADHKPIYVQYGWSGGSGGVEQEITFEIILEESNKNFPVLGTQGTLGTHSSSYAGKAMGVWEVCNDL
jgi:hypothetical protein